MVDGAKLVLRGREVVLPPLTAGHLEDFEEEFKRVLAISGVPTRDDLAALRKLTHAALLVNYPHTKEEEVRDLLDLRNMARVIEALLGASGFEAAPPGAPAP